MLNDMTPKHIKSEAENGDQQIADPDECFVIMPISDQLGYDAGHFFKVYEDIFRPACVLAGYNPTRADGVKESNLIHLDILKRVVHAPMAICDLSGRNPNVLFELGLRQAFDMPTILVKDMETLDIFDINPIRYTSYHRTLSYREVLADQIAVSEALKATRDAIGKSHNVNSLIRLLQLSSPAKIEASGAAGPQDYFQILMEEIGQLKREIRNKSRPAEASSVIRNNSGSTLGRAFMLGKMVDDIEQRLKDGCTVESVDELINDARAYGEVATEFYKNGKFPAKLRAVANELARLDALAVWDIL